MPLPAASGAVRDVVVGMGGGAGRARHRGACGPGSGGGARARGRRSRVRLERGGRRRRRPTALWVVERAGAGIEKQVRVADVADRSRTLRVAPGHEARNRCLGDRSGSARTTRPLKRGLARTRDPVASWAAYSGCPQIPEQGHRLRRWPFVFARSAALRGGESSRPGTAACTAARHQEGGRPAALHPFLPSAPESPRHPSARPFPFPPGPARFRAGPFACSAPEVPDEPGLR